MGQLIKQFGKIKVETPIPHLLTLQLGSYTKFLQEGVKPEDRNPEVGLEGVFHTVFPIEDFNKTASLQFEGYEIQEPKYDQAECISKGLTYEAPVRIKVRLETYETDDDGERTVRDMKEQDIYFGTLPLMTEKGTFIVNGTERVIVNQLQRSPGIIFEHDGGKTHASRKLLYSCRVIPMRGSWLDFDFDHKDILYVRIDRRRKMPATILFKAMGMSKMDILDTFYPREERETFYLQVPEELKRDGAVFEPDALFMAVKPEYATKEGLDDYLHKEPSYSDVFDKEDNQLATAGKAVTVRNWKNICKNMPAIEVRPDTIVGLFLGDDILDPNTGEVLGEMAQEITPELLVLLRDAGIKEVTVLHTKGTHTSSSIRDTLMSDKAEDTTKAQEEIYRRLRPSSPPTPEIATNFFGNIFRNLDYYDLSPVGRYKLNQRLGISDEECLVDDGKGGKMQCRTLMDSDIIRAIRELCRLKDTNGAPDDIDHLGNRRVRLVGELVENQYRIGLVRMERAIKERMSSQETSTLMPHDLINPKPVAAVLKEFFGTSQLSQFMDQTNALSEVTHKRRLSALGPGGLTRDRAGFEVRDVHTSHYGRICPIETPEGPNIGLIVSMTTYAKVNEFGFIETPYRVVRDCVKTNEIFNLDATRETGEQVVAQANARVDEAGRLLDDYLTVRARGDVTVVPKEEVTLMDVAPGQMVSISAALIPFLEHDDANRALMGSNMQRQAVPLLRSERPLVGTGMEVTVARDSGACLVAPADGEVKYADADRIIVSYEGGIYPETNGIRAYDLLKYHKSNQNTCFGQKATCMPGQKVKKGDVLADGPGIEDGTLALGKNLTVAFMPWCGYNYEDAILISEKVVKEDIFTSIHIEEFEVVARDTKLGPEEITNDIPNVSEDMRHNLDESGIIRIGASVKTDDILVGKITPKGETLLTPEEKLLRAIFGDKAKDVKNTSLKVPPGVEGTVIDVKVFNRRTGEKDERTKNIEQYEINILNQKEDDHIRILGDSFRKRLTPVVLGKQVVQTVMHPKHSLETLVDAGSSLTAEHIAVLPVKKFANLFKSREVNDQVAQILEEYEAQLAFIKKIYDSKRDKVTEGDDLAPGVVRMVKVYVAIKRKLSVGDKMAGRHGNKGVVSMILPQEDMPFFADGRPVDIVLNPLGVPSRMNIGQILETHLGWGAKELGRQLAGMIESGQAMQVVRDEVKNIFASEDISKMVDEMDDETLRVAVRKLKTGIITRTPVFDGATEEEIWGWMKKSIIMQHRQPDESGVTEDEIWARLTQEGYDDDGKTVLYDGRTGERFQRRVTVGVMYMLKLHHLVDEKIHARSTGPYSLVTQQPLGGKAQFGGQRLGEMEVWGLEAYGASYLLQEFLTIKSDDVTGRVKMYEKIVKGDNFLEAGLPESFNVLVKELMSLGLNVTLHQEESKKRPGPVGLVPFNER